MKYLYSIINISLKNIISFFLDNNDPHYLGII